MAGSASPCPPAGRDGKGANVEITGVCLLTRDAPRLAAFYQTVFREEPRVEGGHYGFGRLAIYDPGGVEEGGPRPAWLQARDPDIDALHARLRRELPGLRVLSPPQRRPWGAYSFWFADPDGNRIAGAQSGPEPAAPPA